MSTLDTEFTALQNQLTMLWGYNKSLTATSAQISTAVANVTEVRAGVQAVVTAAGFDSDLVSQRAALQQAILDASIDLHTLMMLIAKRDGTGWPPNAGPNSPP